MSTLYLNLYGGPSAGKSTNAAALFALAKQTGMRAELVTEYAKYRVWSESPAILKDQLYVFAKQRHRMIILEGKVDLAVTDSPLLLSLVYGRNLSSEMQALFRSEIHTMWNLNVFIERTTPYEQQGRIEDEYQARLIDQQIKDLLDEEGMPYYTIPDGPEAPAKLFKLVQEHLNPDQPIVLENQEEALKLFGIANVISNNVSYPD